MLALLIIISSLVWINIDAVRVGIIGAGIGGSSAAYFLSQDVENVDITVFEKTESVGGRLSVARVDGREYESGGSIIHNSNRMMLQFLDICNLKKKQPISSETFSMMNDGGAVFQETGSAVIDKLRLAWRYGPLQLMKLERYYQNILDKFVSIYSHLEDGTGYPTVDQLLSSMDPQFVRMLEQSLGSTLLEEVGLDRRLVDEVVSVATKFNYGQLPAHLHSFVGAVALIGFDKQLFAVEGGNYKVSQCALNLSKARIVQKDVKTVIKEEHGFRIVGENDKFDVIIVATPLTQDHPQIQFEGFEEDINIGGKYHQTLSTIVRADLNVSALSNTSISETHHYIFLSPSFPVWSIETMTPVDYDPSQDDQMQSVYRLFSHQPVPRDFLEIIFNNITHVSTTDWLAYPQYSTVDDKLKFELSPGLFYNNVIETAASAMEMSVIGARNIVNLINPRNIKITVKDEL